MALQIGLLVLVVATFALLLWQQRRALPTRIARKRLDAQIERLRSQRSMLQIIDREYVPHQEAFLRQRWLGDQMKSRTVESLEVPGIGSAILETLADHGIRSLKDVELLRHRKIPGVGEKRAAQLWTAYQDERERLRTQARQMSADEVDRVSGGQLQAAIDRHEAEERQRLRALELAEIQLAEVERRRSQLARTALST